MNDIILEAELRTAYGRSASRRLRKEGKLPGIYYGHGEESKVLSLIHKDVMKASKNPAFMSSILTLKLDGKSLKVVAKDVHMHPYKQQIMHMDLQHVSMKEKIHMAVPINFVGHEDAPGIAEGGVFTVQMNEVEITCLPGDLPSQLEIDASQLNLDEGLHLLDLKLPKGVEFTAFAPLETEEERQAHNQPLANISIPRAVVEEPAEGEEVEGEEGAEGEAAAEGGEAAPEAKADEEKKDEDNK